MSEQPKPPLTREEKCKRMIQQLSAVAEQFNSGCVKIVLRDENEKAISAFIYVDTNPDDVEAVVKAVEAVENTWHE